MQGDACAELAALSHPGKLAVSSHGQVAPGGTVTVTGHGYRNGESVAFSIGSTSLGSAIAGASGAVSFQATIPSAEAPGQVTISLDSINGRVLATATAQGAPGAATFTVTALPGVLVGQHTIVGWQTVGGTTLQASLGITFVIVK